MIAGVELGLDAPTFALHVRVFSDIFLRLIRTIVAPLILGTLICGIAAHGSSKDVGRIGLKSLVYFEISTTLALAVGLIAINISHAGNGLVGKLTHVVNATPVSKMAKLGTSSCYMSFRKTWRKRSLTTSCCRLLSLLSYSDWRWAGYPRRRGSRCFR